MIKPQPMEHEELVRLLQHITASVEDGDSLEGSIEWLLPTEDDGAPEGTDYMVTAGFRVGNSQGQGGFMQIGTYVEDPAPLPLHGRDCAVWGDEDMTSPCTCGAEAVA